MKTTWARKAVVLLGLAALLGTRTLLADAEERVYTSVDRRAAVPLWRVLDGKIYNSLTGPSWLTIPDGFTEWAPECVVREVTPEGTIMDIRGFSGRRDRIAHLRFILVKRHPGKDWFVTGDELLPFRAALVGRAQVYGETVAVYDFGVPYQPPPPKPLTPEQEEANAAAAHKQKIAGELATFKFYQERANSGDATAEFRLGQLYLEGKGCEVNVTQAKAWFKKAADQGSEGAQKELGKLK